MSDLFLFKPLFSLELIYSKLVFRLKSFFIPEWICIFLYCLVRRPLLWSYWTPNFNFRLCEAYIHLLFKILLHSSTWSQIRSLLSPSRSSFFSLLLNSEWNYSLVSTGIEWEINLFPWRLSQIRLLYQILRFNIISVSQALNSVLYSIVSPTLLFNCLRKTHQMRISCFMFANTLWWQKFSTTSKI